MQCFYPCPGNWLAALSERYRIDMQHTTQSTMMPTAAPPYAFIDIGGGTCMAPNINAALDIIPQQLELNCTPNSTGSKSCAILLLLVHYIFFAMKYDRPAADDPSVSPLYFPRYQNTTIDNAIAMAGELFPIPKIYGNMGAMLHKTNATNVSPASLSIPGSLVYFPTAMEYASAITLAIPTERIAPGVRSAALPAITMVSDEITPSIPPYITLGDFNSII